MFLNAIVWVFYLLWMVTGQQQSSVAKSGCGCTDSTRVDILGLPTIFLIWTWDEDLSLNLPVRRTPLWGHKTAGWYNRRNHTIWQNCQFQHTSRRHRWVWTWREKKGQPTISSTSKDRTLPSREKRCLCVCSQHPFSSPPSNYCILFFMCMSTWLILGNILGHIDVWLMICPLFIHIYVIHGSPIQITYLLLNM